MKQSPCLKCDHREVREGYNCHADCKEYAEFKDCMAVVNEARSQYQRERPYESVAKLKKVGRKTQ